MTGPVPGWESLGVKDLRLPPRVIAALLKYEREDTRLRTAGDFVLLIREGGTLTDVPGIGRESNTLILAELERLLGLPSE